MWLMTRFGFFSVVQKKGDGDLTVRSRSRKDLEMLREKYLPDMGDIIDNAGTDYPCRARVSHVEFSEALSKIVLDIDYDNFKNCVSNEQSSQRAGTYGRVWTTLLAIEDEKD